MPPGEREEPQQLADHQAGQHRRQRGDEVDRLVTAVVELERFFLPGGCLVREMVEQFEVEGVTEVRVLVPGFRRLSGTRRPTLRDADFGAPTSRLMPAFG